MFSQTNFKTISLIQRPITKDLIYVNVSTFHFFFTIQYMIFLYINIIKAHAYILFSFFSNIFFHKNHHYITKHCTTYVMHGVVEWDACTNLTYKLQHHISSHYTYYYFYCIVFWFVEFYIIFVLYSVNLCYEAFFSLTFFVQIYFRYDWT